MVRGEGVQVSVSERVSGRAVSASVSEGTSGRMSSTQCERVLVAQLMPLQDKGRLPRKQGAGPHCMRGIVSELCRAVPCCVMLCPHTHRMASTFTRRTPSLTSSPARGTSSRCGQSTAHSFVRAWATHTQTASCVRVISCLCVRPCVLTHKLHTPAIHAGVAV